MRSDGVEGALVKGTGVALEGTSNVKGVLETEDGLDLVDNFIQEVAGRLAIKRRLASLSQSAGVCLLDPCVMGINGLCVNSLLEDNNVRVWDFMIRRAHGAQQRSLADDSGVEDGRGNDENRSRSGGQNGHQRLGQLHLG